MCCRPAHRLQAKRWPRSGILQAGTGPLSPQPAQQEAEGGIIAWAVPGAFSGFCTCLAAAAAIFPLRQGIW